MSANEEVSPTLSDDNDPLHKEVALNENTNTRKSSVSKSYEFDGSKRDLYPTSQGILAVVLLWMTAVVVWFTPRFFRNSSLVFRMFKDTLVCIIICP